jgi:outer membrane protein TolC
MVNIKMVFYHPKYYKELRKLRNKLDQVISRGDSTEAGRRSPDPGLKSQAPSSKQEVTSDKLQAKPEPSSGS